MLIKYLLFTMGVVQQKIVFGDLHCLFKIFCVHLLFVNEAYEESNIEHFTYSLTKLNQCKFNPMQICIYCYHIPTKIQTLYFLIYCYYIYNINTGQCFLRYIQRNIFVYQWYLLQIMQPFSAPFMVSGYYIIIPLSEYFI
jgi:hypothetical protein